MLTLAMLSKAFNMLRSFRNSGEFFSNEGKRDRVSNISLGEISPQNTVIKGNTTYDSGTDKINNTDPVQCNYNIQPRASIRAKHVDSMKFNEDLTPKVSEKVKKGKRFPDLANQDENHDESVIIIDEILPKSNVSVNKRSTLKIRGANAANEIIQLNEDDEPGPLVIDENDTQCSVEHSSSDSQSLYCTSPQEVFDLCENEIKVLKRLQLVQQNESVKEIIGPQQENEKETDGSPVPCKAENGFKILSKAVKRKRVAIEKYSTTDTSLQSNLKGSRCSPPASVSLISERTNEKTKRLMSVGNDQEEGKKAEDDIVRLKLHIQGTKKKKLFNIKMSQLLAMLGNKHHPLHKWQHLITLENVGDLSQNEKMKLIKILADFLEAKAIPVKY